MARFDAVGGRAAQGLLEPVRRTTRATKRIGAIRCAVKCARRRSSQNTPIATSMSRLTEFFVMSAPKKISGRRIPLVGEEHIVRPTNNLACHKRRPAWLNHMSKAN